MIHPTKTASVERTSVRGRAFLTYLIIFLVTAATWLWAICAFSGHPVLLGTALLAYCLGLRHAVDADHIAAIDNVTRKLMQDGQRAVNVGAFFALGHSAVVILASAAVAATAAAIQGKFDAMAAIGGIIGTTVSAIFLFTLAALNIVVLLQTYRTFQQVKRTGRYVEEDLHTMLGGGLLSRLMRPLFRLVRQSWQMIPIGFLFGLGFDTSTEVAALGISAAGVAKGLSIWTIMIFPMLFTAGMTLVDTTDGVLMLGAYQWAFVTPMRKLYYNLTITSVSVVVALVVGGIETLGLIGDQLGLQGAFWHLIGFLNDHFNTIGFIIIGIFLLCWIISVIVYRMNRYDEIEVTAGPAA